MLLSRKPAFNLQLNRKDYQEEASLKLYRKGEKIPQVDSGFWQVYRGVVQLNRLSNTRKETVIGWVNANHAFGSTIDGNSAYSAIAISDVYLRHYTNQDVAKNPQLTRQLISELSYRLLQSEQMLMINSFRKVEDKLKGLLLMFKQEMGYSVNNGIRLSARFTHQNIADAICTTRVTVTRIFGDWQNQGLLEFDEDRHLIIKF